MNVFQSCIRCSGEYVEDTGQDSMDINFIKFDEGYILDRNLCKVEFRCYNIYPMYGYMIALPNGEIKFARFDKIKINMFGKITG